MRLKYMSLLTFLENVLLASQKFGLDPPKSTIYGGSKLAFIYPKTAGIKIAQKRPLKSTEHKNGKEGNFRFGSPLTVTNLGGEAQKLPLFTPKTAGIKIAQKRPLEFTERKNDKDSTFRFG